MNILKLELLQNKKNTIIFIVSICLVIILLLAAFPSMQTEAMQSIANAKMDGLSPALLASLGLSEMVDFSIITNFFGYLFQFLSLAVLIYISQKAYNLFLKEEKTGTIEYIYSKPVSRKKIYINKILSVIIEYMAIILAMFLTSFAGYLLFGDLSFVKSLKETGTLFLGLYIVGLVYIALSMLLSLLIKDSKNISAGGSALVMFTFIIGIVSSIVSKFDKLIYFSPIKWLEYNKLLEGIILKDYIFIIILLIVISIYIAYNKFNKRDFLT